jgi:hypothetical protein
MNDFPLQVWTGVVWFINGILVLAYLAVDHIIGILLIVSVAAFAIKTPSEHRNWAIGSGALAVLAAFLSPEPVPPFLLAMSLAGWAVQYLEKYNRPAQRWNTIKSVATYALMGLGYTVVLSSGILSSANYPDPMMAQGTSYIRTIAAIAMFVIPFVFIGMAVQTTLALPPSPGGSPEQLITRVRTRGKN